jgi:creatinine amidohydrolase/Fe(II)-dependent formamide hydrolase-like protein
MQFPVAGVREAVRSACHALRSIGARKALLITFHGEPLHNLELEAGARWLRERGIPTMCPMNSLMNASLELEPGAYPEVLATIPDETVRAAYRESLNSDFHGGLFETSLMLRWRPEAVDPDWKSVPPCPFPARKPALSRIAGLARKAGRKRFAAELDFANDAVVWTKGASRVGYTGYPGYASAEAGRVFSEAVSTLMARDYRAYFEEKKAPPEPIFKWVGALSLGGRI